MNEPRDVEEFVKARIRILKRVGDAMASEPEHYKGGDDLSKLCHIGFEEKDSTKASVVMQNFLNEKSIDELAEMHSAIQLVTKSLGMLEMAIVIMGKQRVMENVSKRN